MASGFRKLLSLIFVLAGVAAAQTKQQQPSGPAFDPNAPYQDSMGRWTYPSPSAQPRKDIPAIAKAANGAIVTIVMAAGDKPIARGTGFLVSADGVIVTNYHVIETGNVAIVKFPDGTILPVDGVLAADKVRDLAVIKIHGRTFRTLTLGNSDQIQVGEEVVAIGNPLGLELTVSNGILSGVRTDKAGKFLQITAPFTHGSSGGPLFNMMGEVIGITTLVYEGAGDLNFAIPVNDAKRLLSNQSSKLQSLPNETEPTESQKQTHAEDAPPSASKASLKDTLQWMHNTLPDKGMSSPVEKIISSTKLIDFSGCQVHFTVDLHSQDTSGADEVVRNEYFLASSGKSVGNWRAQRWG